MIIKSVGVLSAAKVSGVLYAVLGFVGGLFFSLFSLVLGSFTGGMDAALPGFGVFFGVGAVILLPIFYGLIGFVSGALAAWVYNVIVKWVGGIEIEFEDDRKVQAPVE
ncbi:MAG: hypothetical protein ACE5FH_11030 [Candidatus Zixiibacteriota bacterium]